MALPPNPSTLGSFIDALQSLKDNGRQALPVVFDFATAVPARFGSFAAFPDSAALGFYLSGYDDNTVRSVVTVDQMLSLATAALTSAFKKWETSEAVTFGVDTELWIANAGNTERCGFVDITEVNDVVYINTSLIVTE